MALLDINKVTLIAHKANKDAVMKTLQSLGAVEIISADADELSLFGVSRSLGDIESKLSDLRKAIELIKKYDETKTSFLTPKPAISPSQLKNMDIETADKVISSINGIAEDANSLKSKKQRLKNRISQLEQYKGFDAPLEIVRKNAFSTFLLGTIPADSAEEYARIRESYDSAYFETVGGDKENIAVFAAVYSGEADKLFGELKYLGFSEAFTKDLRGTPLSLIASYEQACVSLDSELASLEEKTKSFARNILLLREYEDYLTNEAERERSIERLGETGSAFLLEGWVIADEKDKIEQALLEAAPESYISFRAPLDDETPPTAIRNKKLVQPFEMVTEMYSTPSARGFDPNAVMSIFYFILFGMMIGDAAYGVILTIGAWVVLRLKKPTGTFRKVVTIVMYCGISTVIWGLIFGTVFAIPGIPALINPIENALTTLILCLGIGVVHILVGLGVGAYILIKRKEYLAALFDKVSWIIVLLGGVMIALGGTAGSIGMYMLIGGLLTVLLTAGRSKKGILRKFISGFAGVYGATGYISDILSYCRLFGMGLATSVIAMVFNTIAGLFFGNVVGYIVAAIIMTVGHVFNIAINALGAFVHTARLQFIEFYSKFYEGGGRAFAPLGLKTKNFRLED